MLKRINYYLWYLYFSVYWSSSNLGAKKPESNAVGLFNLFVLLNFAAIFQILEFFGHKFSGIIFMFFCGVPAFLIPYLLFQRKHLFHSRFKEFEFLRAKEYKRKRIIAVISAIVFSILFCDGMAVLRNLTHSL